MKLSLLFLTLTSLLIGAEQSVTVGVFDLYPAVFEDSGGVVKGYYIDILNEIGNRENIEFNYVYGSWEEGIERLKKSEVDLLTSVAYTEGRSQFMSYGEEPLLTVWSELYTLPSSEVKSVLDLKGRQIAVMANDYNGVRFKELIKKFNILPEYIEYPDFDAVMSAVQNGEVDAGVVSVIYGTAKHEEFGLTSTGVVANPFEIFFTVHKGHENQKLLDLLDSYLKKWSNEENSFYQQAKIRWNFGAGERIRVIPRWIWIALAFTVIIVMIGAVFIFLLKARVKKVVSHILEEEEKNRKLQGQLHQSQKLEAVGQLAGGIAHDFNNVLAGIIGLVEVIKTKSLSLAVEGEYLDLILKAADRASDLTKKLLTFSRQNTKVSTAVDVTQIVNDTASLLSHTVDKAITISVDNRAIQTSVIGDDSQLQNIIMNIGINASHAMPSGGKLVFTMENLELDAEYCEFSPFEIKPGDYLEITIRDTGIGMKSEVVSRIFEPFFTTKKVGDGTGLGLAAVYGAVKDHDGAINVYSEEGTGTVFHIYLPVTSESIKRDIAVVDHPKATGTILIIDDEELIRITASAVLKSLGYKVILAENGLEGVNTFREISGQVDLIILDMIMPVMGGREAFSKLREVRSDIPIVISSGFSKGDDLQELKKQGVNGFLAKPFRKEVLVETLSEILSAE
jgi:signal transduction histidine kinase/ActR/RegA family two-component response regulator